MSARLNTDPLYATGILRRDLGQRLCLFCRAIGQSQHGQRPGLQGVRLADNRSALNGKPFCNRMMYGVLRGLLQLWTPENENRIPKDLPILVTCGTGDPVGGMTTSVSALIERYQQYGVRDVSHIFYEGARHEPLNDFCRDQIHADVLAWLEARL